MKISPALTRHECGHVGRKNVGRGATVQAFIRVAEVRGATVTVSDKKCPDCQG